MIDGSTSLILQIRTMSPQAPNLLTPTETGELLLQQRSHSLHDFRRHHADLAS
jgi:hypothetical protein